MSKQPVPLDEALRLAELQALGLLDTHPEKRFDRITRIAQRAFDVPIALITLVDQDRQWFKSRIGLEASETPREVSFCAHAIMGDEILQVRDASADERFRGNRLVTEDPSIRFYAGCPIDSPNGHKLGTLCVIDRRPRELSPEDLEILRDLASLVEDEVASYRLTVTDSLTHLHNRRGLLLLGQHVLRFAKRMGKPAALVFIDLDGMKRINDELGHEAGDRALVETAGLLRETLRESDLIARLGGDEFCILFSGSSAHEAEAAVSRLQGAVEQQNQASSEGPVLSLSVGVADWDPDSDETLDELMKRADREMYSHKRSKNG